MCWWNSNRVCPLGEEEFRARELFGLRDPINGFNWLDLDLTP